LKTGKKKLFHKGITYKSGMTEYDQLIQSLSQYPSKRWLNRYFDLLKRLLTDFAIESDDPRLALSLKKDKQLPVNLGQRYILKPYVSGYIGLIVPAGFDEKAVAAETIFAFTTSRVVDAKFIKIQFVESIQLSALAYNACKAACMDILKRAKRTGYRKYHSPLLYDFTMEPAVRSEILNEVDIRR